MPSDNPAYLDEGQREAVFDGSTRILVTAPPGSGKTKTLVERFVRLVKGGAAPEEILAVTFTNRAAAELGERLSMALGNVPLPHIGTFHGLCLKLLKKAGERFTLIGRDGQIETLKGLGVKGPARAADRISTIKNRLFSGEPESAFEAEDLEIFKRYEGLLGDKNLLDLDGLVIRAVGLLRARGMPGRPFTHVLVDEFQDINPAQADLVRRLVSDRTSLFAIGDPDQSIYGFRGSCPRAFLDFEKDHPGARVIRLSNNYRSMAGIVRASQALISNNPGRVRTEVTPATTGGAIRLVQCDDERAEAGFIIREIEARMGGLTNLTIDRDGEGARFSDFAVLFRTNQMAAPLIEAFGRSSLPFHHVKRPGPAVKDFLLGLRPSNGRPLDGLIKAKAPGAGLDAAVLEMLVQMAANGTDLDGLIQEASLLDPSDAIDVKADRVNLMTMHLSKGLEFRHVFIAGFEAGLVPFAGKGKTDVVEERRLLYVAMTRAREGLYLLRAKKRALRGGGGGGGGGGGAGNTSVSPFLPEIPAELFSTVDMERKKTRKRPVQTGLFE